MERIFGIRRNLDVQLMALEDVKFNAGVHQAMRAGVSAMKNELKKTDVDEVHFFPANTHPQMNSKFFCVSICQGW